MEPAEVARQLLASTLYGPQMLAVVERTAKLNCAKPPMGKHYQDPDDCGECTSCEARALLRKIDA